MVPYDYAMTLRYSWAVVEQQVGIRGKLVTFRRKAARGEVIMAIDGLASNGHIRRTQEALESE